MDNKCGFQNTNERERGGERRSKERGWGKRRGGGKRAAEAAPLGRGMRLTERGKALTPEIGESFSL
jgi:hypothetical protein